MLRLLRRKAQKLRKETGDNRWQAPIEKLNRSVARTVLRSTYRPILLLVLEPMCLNLCIFSGILLGILYLFFGAFQLVFGNVYGFELWQRGLCFLGLFVGMVFAIVSDPFWRRVYARLEKHHERVEGKIDDPQPEWRLPPGMIRLFRARQWHCPKLTSGSGCWRSSGHHRPLYLCLDDLSQRPLDRSHHWQRVFRGRVSSYSEEHL